MKMRGVAYQLEHLMRSFTDEGAIGVHAKKSVQHTRRLKNKQKGTTNNSIN
jgi:hypothetical protein